MSEATITEPTAKHCSGYVGVHRSELPGTLIFIVVDDRATFDLIDLPESGNDKVRHKAIDGEQHVVFQYWLEKSR